MARVLIVSGNAASVTQNANVTSYKPVGFVFEGATETTENNTKIPFNGAGMFSNLYIRITANTVTAASTFRLRKNNNNVNQSVSITASTTGEFEDNSNTDIIASGDDMNYQLVTGATGTSLSVSVASIVFKADSNTLMKLVASSTAGLNMNTSSGTMNVSVIHLAETGSATALVPTEIKQSATWRNLYCYISTNSRLNTSTLQGQIGGSAGNQSISISAGSTGAFEDTSNSDSLSSGNQITYGMTNGAGTETLTVQVIASELLTTDGAFTIMTGRSGSNQITSASGTDYQGLGGVNSVDTSTEANKNIDMNFSAIANNLWLFVTTNTLNGATTFTLRKNSADTALTLSVGSSTTGEFEDVSNSVSLVAVDEVCIEITEAASSGNMTYKQMSMKLAENFADLAAFLNATSQPYPDKVKVASY